MNIASKALEEMKRQPRVAFFLGAQMALGWELTYEELSSLAEHTRSMVECFEVLDAMKPAKAHRRLAAGLICIAERRDREREADKVCK